MDDAHACRLAAAIGAAALLATAPVMGAHDAPSWLQVCAADAPTSPTLRVHAGPQPDGCPGIALPVAPGQIAAVRPAAPSERVTEARTILIYLPERAGQTGTPAFGALETVLPPAAATHAPAARTVAPLHVNLLDRLQLQPQASTSPVPPRATWVWRAKEWIGDPAGVLARARRHGMRSLFITVPTQGAAIPQPARLAAFARQASRAGIALWAVEGDPHMALPAHHAATADRVRAVAAYNRSVEPAARLQGVQFDIEHYLIDGYGMASERHDLGYAQLLASLKAAAGGLPLDFVVPFWWQRKDTLLAALAQAASVVTVMDYRTDEAQVRDLAAPFLDWGVTHRVGVRIALESGPVAPERQHRYVRADGAPAELWAITLSPEQTGLTAPFDALVLLKQPHAGLPGTGFRYSGNRLLDGSATTFQRQPARLQALLPQLERDFSAWSSFAGMAVHEPAAMPDRPPSGAR